MLILKELQARTWTHTHTNKQTPNIRGKIHKARSSQLLLLPTNTEDTREAVSDVQVLTTAKRTSFCLLLARQEIL
jgi:hypothetical protein